MCDVELEDPASASSAIRRALFIDPNLWPAWLLLGQLSELDDPMLASTCFSRALTVLEVSGSRRGGALAPFEEGREMAREALRQRLGRR